MASYRKDRKVPPGFRRYTGEYEKTWYDIYTWNGAVFHTCWPNAGTFHHKASGRIISGRRVFAIKAQVEEGSSKLF